MNLGTWEMKAGDPAAFCFRIAFTPNPEGDQDRATADERDSWGNFTIWAGGENLCAHIEESEELQAVHWYMLPLLEWLTDNWDPLLHEERPPLRNVGTSAAESLARNQQPPVSLKEIDDLDWLDTWSEWWSRHSVRAAREGGLFPDIYFRRYRDKLEVSTGADTLPGTPHDFRFLAPNRSYHVDLSNAADAIYRVLFGAVEELRRRLPDSSRIYALTEKVASLAQPSHEPARIAWLAGLSGKYQGIASSVEEIFAKLDFPAQRSIVDTRPADPLVVVGSAYARLLYGAISPATGLKDVLVFVKYIIDNYVSDASSWLAKFDLPLDTLEIAQLSPGEQGSRLGEKACELLAPGIENWVDIRKILGNMGVKATDVELSDTELRAVSLFGPTQRPHVLVNSASHWANSPNARRFTLAHELCHLILDREYGDELAIASGPWAPPAIEQRANAFAAAFLMPTWLLREELAAANTRAYDLEMIQSVSAKLHVSTSSLIDRLYNLGELTSDERLQLRPLWPPQSR